MKDKKKYPSKMLWNAEEWTEDFTTDFPKPDNKTCDKIFDEVRSRTAGIHKQKKQLGFRFLHLRWFYFALSGSIISILLLICFQLKINNQKSVPAKQLNVQKIFEEEKNTLAATEKPQPALIVEQYDNDFDERIFDMKQQIVK